MAWLLSPVRVSGTSTSPNNLNSPSEAAGASASQARGRGWARTHECVCGRHRRTKPACTQHSACGTLPQPALAGEAFDHPVLIAAPHKIAKGA